MTPPITYILIDYENVHPTDLGMLCDGPFKIKLFLGACQSKIPVSLARSLHSLGENAEYIQLTSNGSNALDFHIAYYIGRLSALDPAATFLIISNDAGFDPLILHLKANGIAVQRSACITTNPAEDDVESTCEIDFEVEALISHLEKQNGSKPRTKKTMMNLIRSLYKKELDESEIALLFRTLCSRGIIKPVGSRIEYELPFEHDSIPF